MRLDPRTVLSLPPGEDGKRKDYADDLVRGLRLRVSATGERSFSFVYRFDGAVKRYTIGSALDVTLATARDRARELHNDFVARGIDPMAAKAERRQQRKRDALASRVRDLCDAFVADQAADWRPSTRAGWMRYLNAEVKRVLGDMRPDEVQPEHVRGLVDLIAKGVPAPNAERDENGQPLAWKRKPAPTSARRLFEVTRRLFAWAVWKKYLRVSPCDAAREFKRKRKGRKNGAHKPFSDDALRGIFKAAKNTELEDLIDLIARTGVRAHEARSARRSDFDLGRRQWSVPPEFHKTGDETGAPHLVPLSSGALAIVERRLAAVPAESPWLWPAPTGPCEVCGQKGHADKANKASAAVKAAAGISDRGLLHRMRDTLKTRMSEHGIDARVSEHVLAHKLPGIMGVYDHAELLPQRLAALEWWSSELDRILAGRPAEAAKVLAMPRRGRRRS